MTIDGFVPRRPFDTPVICRPIIHVSVQRWFEDSHKATLYYETCCDDSSVVNATKTPNERLVLINVMPGTSVPEAWHWDPVMTVDKACSKRFITQR